MSLVKELPPLSKRVHSARAGNVDTLALRTPLERVVSFEVSFRTDPDFEADEEVQQQLAIALLDKGTLKRDRFEIAEALDDRGAQLTFSADGIRCSATGRCLTEDLPAVLELVAEQLREPLFDEDEFRKAKAQQTAAVRRIMDDTGSQAHGALARRFYQPAHPNYRPDLAHDLARVEALTVEGVRSFHADHLGTRDAVAVLVGDLDPDEATRAVQETLGDWEPPTASAKIATSAVDSDPGRTDVPMEDKPNLDVRIGQPLALRRDHEDYLPLYVGVYILGGNFAARLMATIRDEQGLTYGIGARLSGVSIDHDAYFLTSVTLSQDVLEKGIAATMEQVERFIVDGITADELEEKKTTLTGSFRVGMATSRGLASAILGNAERGFDVGYLDRFPSLIEALDVDNVNEVIRRHLDPAAMHLAVAGSLP